MTQRNAAYALLGMMLLSAVLALVAALYVRAFNAHDGER
ncbi:hypothetical protein BDSB_20050 [Burkholderia dolosa PC543]|nr:hypothetical protein BDSB_20050 [Burkholderia dolosa PC543]